jgi:predicted permease
VNLVLTVLEIVAPVFLLGAIGFVWVRLGFEYRTEFVTRLAMKLAVPALIFTSLMKSDIDPGALSAVSLAAAAAYGLITAGVWLVALIFRLEMRTYLAPLIFGNTGNIGLPVALFAFGNDGLAYAVVVFAIMSVYAYSAGIWMVSGGGSPLRMLREPMVWATLAGLLFLWQDWETPRVITRTLELLGQLMIPLMLITLGVAVARLPLGAFGRAFALSLAKALICVPAAWWAGRWFGLDPVPFAVLVLQVATPVAVTSYLIAQKYGADADAVAGLVVASTLLAVLLIPGLLAVLL